MKVLGEMLADDILIKVHNKKIIKKNLRMEMMSNRLNKDRDKIIIYIKSKEEITDKEEE
jgi:hypothetical protein